MMSGLWLAGAWISKYRWSKREQRAGLARGATGADYATDLLIPTLTPLPDHSRQSEVLGPLRQVCNIGTVVRVRRKRENEEEDKASADCSEDAAEVTMVVESSSGLHKNGRAEGQKGEQSLRGSAHRSASGRLAAHDPLDDSRVRSCR